MDRTTTAISDNIDRQHIQIQQLMPVRTLVTQTLEASDVETVKTLQDSCQSLMSQLDDKTGEFKGIHIETRALIDTKYQQLVTREELRQSLEQTLGLLDEITGLTQSSVNATENDSIGTMEKEIASLSGIISSLAQSGNAPTDDNREEVTSSDLGDIMDELMMTSEMSISAVRAALSVQAVTIRQQSMINTLFHLKDAGELPGLQKQILSLQGNINSELVELPEAQTTQDLIRALAGFSDTVKTMFGKKELELAADTALKEKALRITDLMRQVEKGLLEASSKVKASVGSTMENTRGLIGKWQATQVILALCAIALALVIGLMVAAVIVRPIRSAIVMLKDIARGEGDLTMRLDESGKDEISEMAGWFNRFVEKIQSIILEIIENTRVLDQSSQALLALSRDLSQGADKTSRTAQDA